jgi:glycosyl transferase family 25
MNFEPLNNYFDRIFVITLKRAEERHEQIRESLHGLGYEFFFGEDKHDHNLQELSSSNIYSEKRSMHFHRYDKPMTLGHICCSWSHLHIYEKMIAENLQRVLIFEDDVFVNESNDTYLPEILDQLPRTWELLYLGWEKHENVTIGSKVKQWWYHLQHALSFIKINHTEIKNLYPKKYSANLMKAGFHDCTHAYGITLSAAKKLKELQTPIAYNADSLLTHAITNQVIEAYIAVPKIFNQQSQYTTDRSHSFVMD